MSTVYPLLFLPEHSRDPECNAPWLTQEFSDVVHEEIFLVPTKADMFDLGTAVAQLCKSRGSYIEEGPNFTVGLLGDRSVGKSMFASGLVSAFNDFKISEQFKNKQSRGESKSFGGEVFMVDLYCNGDYAPECFFTREPRGGLNIIEHAQGAQQAIHLAVTLKRKIGGRSRLVSLLCDKEMARTPAFQEMLGLVPHLKYGIGA